MINLENIEKRGNVLFYESEDGNRHYFIGMESDGCFSLTAIALSEPDEFGDSDATPFFYDCFSAFSTAILAIEEIEAGKEI